jgi:murein L,D-transpeptidase YcbB/YkuD
VIALNLDRLRGLPSDGRRYIVVDTAGAQLRMMENGQEAGSMRVIVGKQAMPTPQLAGLMRFAIINPYWNVPPDLVRNSVAPHVMREGAGYLEKRRFALFSGWQSAIPDVDPMAVDWAAVAAGRQNVWIRQLPGGDNMMGEIKFMLPNRLGIYLHDTPRKGDFGRRDRRLSSGCVRLEDARRLARWIFGRPLLPSGGGQPETRIDLPQRIPVFITYLTAVPQAGEVRFQKDVYHRDAAQLNLMAGRT